METSGGWERVRLCIETKENMPPPPPRSETRTISSHVLDTAVGRAAANIVVTIYRLESGNAWRRLNAATTNEDGRVAQLLRAEDFSSGTYKLHFDVRPYFEAHGAASCFYPFIEIAVQLTADAPYHIPLLLSPFGYSTYRGT